MSGKYDDLLDRPHPTSRTHPRMSSAERAAQFAPFAALTGHEAAIRETARLTDRRVELDEYAKVELDGRLRLLAERLRELPEVTLLYFVDDGIKSGGAYVERSGRLKKIDAIEGVLTLADGTRVPIRDLYGIESEALRGLL